MEKDFEQDKEFPHIWHNFKTLKVKCDRCGEAAHATDGIIFINNHRHGVEPEERSYSTEERFI